MRHGDSRDPDPLSAGVTHDDAVRAHAGAGVRTSGHDPAQVRRLHRRFAERECQGHARACYRLALAAPTDDDVMGFIAAMPVPQPNLLLATVQRLTAPDEMPGLPHRVEGDAASRRGGHVIPVVWRR